MSSTSWTGCQKRIPEDLQATSEGDTLQAAHNPSVEIALWEEECGAKLWRDIDISISAVNVQSLKFLHCSTFLQTSPYYTNTILDQPPYYAQPNCIQPTAHISYSTKIEMALKKKTYS